MDYHGPKSALPPEALARLRLRAQSLLHDRQPAEGDTPPIAPVVDPAPEAAAADAQAPTQAPTEGPHAPDQRRHAERHKTMLSGKLVFNDMSSVVDCFVRDLSDTGARIKLAAPVQLPPIFILRFNNGRYHRCQVRRRAGLEFGVEFLD